MKYIYLFVVPMFFIDVLYCGTTDVYIANNTPYTLMYNVSCDMQSNNVLKNEALFQTYNNKIEPWAHGKVLSIDRRQIARHSTCIFSIIVQTIKDGALIGQKVFLRQIIKKKRLQQVLTYGVNDMLYTRAGYKKIGASPIGRKTDVLCLEDFKVDVLYQDIPKKGLYHDIEYAFTLQPFKNSMFDKNKNILRVYQHNLFMRPKIVFGYDGQIKRAQYIPQEIMGLQSIKPDVVTFNEVFEKKACKCLIENMKQCGYLYHTPVLANRSASVGHIAGSIFRYIFTKKGREKYPTLGNGGVIIFSRWPIEYIDEVTFGKSLSAGFDSLADKGCMYARINKKGKIYNVFATHTDSEDKIVREGQLAVIKEFIDKQCIAKYEPVIISGDMNICKIDPAAKESFNNMLNVLNVELPACKGYKYTFARGGRNILCDNQMLPSLYLDYIFFEKGHVCPKDSYNKILRPRMKSKPWNNNSNHPYYKGRWDFSDHYPVCGYFDFQK